MSDLELFHGARSRLDLKKKLLRKAFDGHSSRTPAQMIALITEHLRRAREIPDEHQQELDDIRAVKEEILDCLRRAQPFEIPPELEPYIAEERARLHKERAEMIENGIPMEYLPDISEGLIRLNAIEKMNGSGQRWEDAPKDEDEKRIRDLARLKPSPNGPN